MEADGIIPLMPPHSAPHLVEYLMEIGPVQAAGMDAAPISWTEMASWEGRTGVTLQPWEARLLRRLSVEYLGETHRAREPGCPAPWGAMTEDRRAAIDSKIRRLFGGLAKDGGRV